MFNREMDLSADEVLWCCESHATSCLHTTGRDSNRYKAEATGGVAFLTRQEPLFNAST